LAARGVPDPRLESETLLAHALATDRLHLYVNYDMPLDEDARSRMRGFIQRRGKGEPTAYILGSREFYGLSFEVDPRCLIPRPETEHLVDEAHLFLKHRPGPAQVLDLCTGSGCIPIALVHKLPSHSYCGVDVSRDALNVAETNRKRLVSEADLTFLCGDLFAPVKEKRFDLILSNPPYITTEEMALLDKSVSEFEPALALHSGKDALVFHRRILREGKAHLTPGGCFILEISARTEGDLSGLVVELGLRMRVVKDLANLSRTLVITS
jgi:release factor glutamine methyltransferase